MSKVSGVLLNFYFFIFFWFWFITTWILIVVFRIAFFKKCKNFVKKTFFSKRKISVFYFEVFGPESAGNKYRSHKWVEILNANKFKAKSVYVFDYREYLQLTSHKSSMPFFLMGFMWFRFLQILQSAFYDIVIVRRELLQFNDYGNSFFEKFLSAVHDKRILDFDDDIAAAKNEPKQISFFGKLLLESNRKFSSSLKYYTAFLLGSRYLKDLLIEWRPEIKDEQILILPTCVDYDNYPPKNYSGTNRQLTIGWVGAKGNLKSLIPLIPALNNLTRKYNFKLLVICDRPLDVPVQFPMEFIKWNQKYEVEQIHLIDIGIMPLANTKTQKGKCGFKLIQYMGCGVVSMATALTANNDIIDDGENGFLIPADDDWEIYFEKVFSLKNQYAEIGLKAYQKIKSIYSFNGQTNGLISFLNQIGSDNK